MSDYLKKRMEHILADRPLKEKKKYVIPKVSKKMAEKLKGQKGSNTDKPIDLWFEKIEKKHFTISGGYCQECGSYIPLQFARHATAHLLPKKLFKSVATHPLNYLILGAGCGCHQMTDCLDKFVKMKVWPEAARRIKEMIPLLPFDELRHISNQLDIALENT